MIYRSIMQDVNMNACDRLADNCDRVTYYCQISIFVIIYYKYTLHIY